MLRDLGEALGVTRARTTGATRAISVRLGAEELAAINAASQEDGLGRASWIRAAIILSLRDPARRRQIRDAASLVLLDPPS